jgi:hypothetical protein
MNRSASSEELSNINDVVLAGGVNLPGKYVP